MTRSRIKSLVGKTIADVLMAREGDHLKFYDSRGNVIFTTPVNGILDEEGNFFSSADVQGEEEITR